MTVGLTEGDERELAALRRRAYGPDADLDPAGERRLRDLEDRLVDAQAPRSAEEHDLPAPPTGETAAPPEVDVGRVAAAPSPLTADPAPDQRGNGRLRHPLLVLAAAVVAGAVLVALGYALAQPPADPDASTLDEVPIVQDRAAVVVGTASFSVRDLDPDTLVQYASLGQGTPWSASRADGVRCLILTVTDDSPEMIAAAGIWDVACAPAGLAPIIDWRVDRSYPSPPQALPEGSVVRLTLEDGRVGLTIGRTG